MELKRAKEVTIPTLPKKQLDALDWFAFLSLDITLTADQRNAIWMRDPEGVVKA